MKFLVPALLIGAVAALPAAAATGDPTAGGETAQRLCSVCHAIAGPGPSRVPQAPPFSSLGRKYPIDSLGEALAEGIVTGHGEVQMPEFTLAPRQIDDLLAYLRSVQR